MTARFAIGDNVKVLQIDPPGHIRTPYFIRGKSGKVMRLLGKYANPEELAYGRDGKPIKHVYQVKFLQKDLWSNYTGQSKDTAYVEVMENWLEKNQEDQITKYQKDRESTGTNLKHDYINFHNSNFVGNEKRHTEIMILARAVEELLLEKNILKSDEINLMLEKLDSQNPKVGARLVAEAWKDPNFKKRLLKDFRSAAEELGIEIGPIRILAIENTPSLHNVVVCTLCSCYPKHLIGLPPVWYKSNNYRSRMIREPRKVLAEFNTIISDNIELRVYDSTAEIRYMILPMPPKNYKELNKEELTALVTRNSMIGVSIL